VFAVYIGAADRVGEVAEVAGGQARGGGHVYWESSPQAGLRAPCRPNPSFVRVARDQGDNHRAWLGIDGE
jgi:hypothetical protein